ncbi:MAG TPA: EF-hand domain-containing protein, partial [Planctomycetaceae bacterium]|nr:EF-hand domain-containing protein [Planctomycetaceae bacterium]
ALIKKYDTNRDGVLDKSEWTKMKFDYSHADVNQDGKITPAELADAFAKR